MHWKLKLVTLNKFEKKKKSFDLNAAISEATRTVDHAMGGATWTKVILVVSMV